MKTGKYEHSFESPAKDIVWGGDPYHGKGKHPDKPHGKSPAKQRLKKGGEAQDENKIFNDKGEHIGNWVGDKKVMFTKKQLINKGRPNTKKKSPVKQDYHEALEHHKKYKKHKQSFDKFQAQKQKGKEFVKNIKEAKKFSDWKEANVAKDKFESLKKTKKAPKMDMTLNENLNKAVRGTKKKVVKKAVKKGALEIAKQVGKKLLGPISAAITAYEVAKTIPKVSKATVKGLKKRAKSGNVNIGRKL